MASLERNLRKDLEKTVKSARRVAEAGARKAVAQLGVGEAEAPKHLTADQRALRNRLRAHGRQLGDRRDAKTGVQDTARLVQECAYEHWHRMLFARFLAETDLLIEPDSGVAISLDEVQGLAREKDTDWLPLASDYAERMLPQIFRKDDPVLDIALPPETRSEMEDLLKDLTKPVFEADDSLGWVYQFWQSDKKDEVNKSEVKIGADELPAVTQLFTEDYMVLFLLHNTLGAWWAGKVLASNVSLATSAPDEVALRAACKVGDIDWTYLRFVRDTTEYGTEGPWRPAPGAFEGWPKAAKDLTVLDPCMGSGHFLVFALPILVAFRMAEEGLSQSAAVDAVLKDNLFGLEIDPRCTQIAAFNLAFAAWRNVGHRPLPQLNLACSGLAIGVTKAEWLKLAEKAVTAADPAAKRDLLGVEKNLLTAGLEERVKNGLEALYDLFAKAPWLGSLIDPRRAGADIFREGFEKLEPLLVSILSSADTDDAREIAVAAQGMARAAKMLGARFNLVITNVPFLGGSRQEPILSDYIEQKYEVGKADLATAMILRMRGLANANGSVAFVSPQTWLFLRNYKNFRHSLLHGSEFNVIAALGTRAFETITGEVVNVTLTSLSNKTPDEKSKFLGIDANQASDIELKAKKISSGDSLQLLQAEQVANPDHAIVLSVGSGLPRLSEYATSWQGLVTGDTSRFVSYFWEIPEIGRDWEFYIASPAESSDYTGRERIVRWEKGKGGLHNDSGAHNFPPVSVLGKKGVLLAQGKTARATLYTGEIFNDGSVPVVPNNEGDLGAIYAFLSDESYTSEVRKINQKLIMGCGYFIKVPFDLPKWREEFRKRYPNGLPKPSSDDPTQWLFTGRPSVDESLHVTVARLLGYRWPRQTGSSFMDAPHLAADGLEPHTDTDGIVCLTALKGEPPAEQRLNAVLADAFRVDWSAAKLAGLLAEASYAGKSLDDWLRDGFFAQHCELFHQRPFIWHIWDGRRDGFHALINYHRLAAPNGEGRRNLEKLIYSYLGDWIDRQRADQKAGIEGADARLAHAEHLKAELIRILEGEPPYDIFVRWKTLHEQPIGWDPDINDGVRMNIRPFMTARTLNARSANACILRATPKIKWDKDRGKEPNRDKADYPWFWGWDGATADFTGGGTFDGNRWNDLHYTRATKQAARTKRKLP
jgi:hypothetical protein